MFSIKKLILPIILLVVLGYGTWQLTESPATWGDEGMLVELAINQVRHGHLESQVAPNQFASGAFMTSGFPVLYPVAASFAVFGMGLLQARAVMVGFMLLCVALAYVFAKRMVGTRHAALAA